MVMEMTCDADVIKGAWRVLEARGKHKLRTIFPQSPVNCSATHEPFSRCELVGPGPWPVIMNVSGACAVLILAKWVAKWYAGDKTFPARI